MDAQRFRVLVVDDDRDILDLVHITLKDQYDVITLYESSHACEILDFCEADAIIVDIMMPKITGYAIVEHLRKSDANQGCIVIFLSAKDTPRDIKYGYKLGANLYITKPFQPDRLARALNAMVSELGNHPRKKQLSMRDVELRLRMQPGVFWKTPPPQVPLEMSTHAHLPDATSNAAHHGSEMKSGTTPASRTSHSDNPEDQEEPREANWVG